MAAELLNLPIYTSVFSNVQFEIHIHHLLFTTCRWQTPASGHV